MKSQKWLASSVGLGVVLLGILAINIISSKLNFRIDVTEDGIFTLSKGTRNILEKVDQDIEVKFFFSKSSKELPVIIKTYATRVEEVLNEYASLGRGMIRVQSYDPKPDTDDEEWARKYGIKSAKLPSGDEVFFGAVFISGTEEITVPYFDPRREEFLEYDLTEAIVQLRGKEKVKVGVLSWLPVMSSGMPQQFGGGENADWVMIQQLRRMYDVVEIDKAAAEIDADIKTLLVIHPKQPSESLMYALDQFVMRGGRLMVFVDPFSRVDLMSSMGGMGMQQMQQSASSDLKQLFSAWGIEYNAEEIVGDLKHTLQINAGGEVLAYPFFVGLTEDSVSKDNVVTSQLTNLLFAEPGAFSLKEGSNLTFEPLISTSKESGTANAMMARFMGPSEFARQMKVDDKVRHMAAVVSGAFKSAFPEGAPAAEEGASRATQPHLAEASGQGMVFLIGDVDFMTDQNSVDQFRFGPQTIIRPKNDNLSLVINAVDYMGGDEDLISIRSRGKIARPFTKVQELQVNAQKKWQDQEERLSEELNDLQKKLSELQAGRTQGNRLVLSEAQQNEIQRFQTRVAAVSKQRREVRKNLREDIESLGKKLVAANMIVLPLVVGVFGFMVFMRRNSNRRKS